MGTRGYIFSFSVEKPNMSGLRGVTIGVNTSHTVSTRTRELEQIAVFVINTDRKKPKRGTEACHSSERPVPRHGPSRHHNLFDGHRDRGSSTYYVLCSSNLSR